VVGIYLGLPYAKAGLYPPEKGVWQSHKNDIVLDGMGCEFFMSGQEKEEGEHISFLQQSYSNATCPFDDVAVEHPTYDEMRKKLLKLEGVANA